MADDMLFDDSDEGEFMFDDSDGGSDNNNDDDDDGDGDDGGSDGGAPGMEVDPETEMMNLYYQSKGDVGSDDPENNARCVEGFRRVVTLGIQLNNELAFKAMKQLVKLLFRLGQYEGMIAAYKELFAYVKNGDLNKNSVEKCLESIIDTVAASTRADADTLTEFYQTTLAGVQEVGPYQRIVFKTNLKLGELHYSLGHYNKLAKIIKQLRRVCEANKTKKGAQLLEVNALEIKMYTATKDNKKLKELYTKSLAISGAVAHPKILGVIRECGGKMYMYEGHYEQAQAEFYKAFEDYDEAADPRRLQCLKYMVLASMLDLSRINPFDGNRAASYKDVPEIQAITQLVDAYQASNIAEFERILACNREHLMADPFIRLHLAQLLRRIRGEVLVQILRPYSRVHLASLAQSLNNIPIAEVESLVISLILDEVIDAKVDQVQQLVVVRRPTTAHQQRYQALREWAKRISLLNHQISTKLQN